MVVVVLEDVLAGVRDALRKDDRDSSFADLISSVIELLRKARLLTNEL